MRAKLSGLCDRSLAVFERLGIFALRQVKLTKLDETDSGGVGRADGFGERQPAPLVFNRQIVVTQLSVSTADTHQAVGNLALVAGLLGQSKALAISFQRLCVLARLRVEFADLFQCQADHSFVTNRP